MKEEKKLKKTDAKKVEVKKVKKINVNVAQIKKIEPKKSIKAKLDKEKLKKTSQELEAMNESEIFDKELDQEIASEEKELNSQLNQTDQQLINQSIKYQKGNEDLKIRIMWSGVAVVMILVVVVWAYNLKLIFSSSEQTFSSGTENTSEVDDFASLINKTKENIDNLDLEDNLADMQESIAPATTTQPVVNDNIATSTNTEIASSSSNDQNFIVSSTTSLATTTGRIMTQSEVDILKKKIEELEKKIQSIATSTK